MRFTAVALLTFLPVTAAAQTGQTPRPAEQRWSISLGLAGTKGGPAREFEAALRLAQFDDVEPDFWGGGPGRETPYSSGDEISGEIEVTYRHSERLAFGLVRNTAELGGTYGYKDPHLFFHVFSQATVIAPVVYLRIGRNLRVGAGPLVAWTDVRTLGREIQSVKSTKGGALVSAVLEGSPIRFTHLAVTASYRWIPKVTAGPFTEEIPGIASATLPAMRVSLSHLSIGASVGLRF